MKSSKFVTRTCPKCKKNIGQAWQGGCCPHCECSLDKWGVNVTYELRCPACNTVITDRELSCSECGNQLEGVSIEHEQ